jgi:hypothetical protein
LIPNWPEMEIKPEEVAESAGITASPRPTAGD